MGWSLGLAGETGCTRIGSPLKYEGNGNDNEVEEQSTYSFIVRVGVMQSPVASPRLDDEEFRA